MFHDIFNEMLRQDMKKVCEGVKSTIYLTHLNVQSKKKIHIRYKMMSTTQDCKREG